MPEDSLMTREAKDRDIIDSRLENARENLMVALSYC